MKVRKDGNPDQMRQGDVLLVRVKKLPKGMKQVGTGPATVALGEATGHSHVIDAPDVQMFESEKATIVRVPSGAPMTHQTHDHISVEPGDIEVIHQYEHLPQGVVRVSD